MKFRNILLISTALLLCAVSTFAATIDHTFVSLHGSNSNPCTAASPCLTFQGALANTTAGGIITAEDAGDFGPLTIEQSVTIDGNNLGSITFDHTGEGTGIIIYGGANITLQNLTINGLASGDYGIGVLSGGNVTVNNCNIMNFTNTGIYYSDAGNLTVENSRIGSFFGSGSVTGIFIESNKPENVVVSSTVIDASPVTNYYSGFVVNGGAWYVYASLQNVTIMGAGNYALWSGTGFTEITNSVLTQSGTGINAQSASTVSVANSLITANTIGVCSKSSIRLDNNDIFDNPTAIANCGGSVTTSTTNKTSGTITIIPSDVTDTVTF